jgi:GntR family transcriptional regulator
VYHLRVAPDARVIYIRWVLYHEDRPIAYDIQYIPYFPGITVWNDNFEYTSFSEIISRKNNLLQINEKMEMEGINSDEEISTILKIPKNTPVFKITQEIFEEEEPMGLRWLYIVKDWVLIQGTSSYD